MTKYYFATKAGKKLAKLEAEQINKKLINLYSKIVPIDIEIDFEDKSFDRYDANQNFIETVVRPIVKEETWFKTYNVINTLKLPLSTKGFIPYIGAQLEYNTNIVVIKSKDAAAECGCNRDTIYEMINRLCKEEVLYRTNKASVYVINTKYIFKGDVATFYALLNKKRKEAPVVYDIDGRIIID